MKKKLVLVLILLMSVMLVPFAPAAQQEGKTAVFILPQTDFQDDEFAQPLAVLKDKGVAVTVAYTTTAEATGMNGAKTMPDMLLKDVQVEAFDAVVFIGGSGAAQYIDDPLAHTIAKEAIAKNKVLGAICLAPRILGNAGVLKGKKATVYPTEGEALKETGAIYTASPVEQDGDIITADGPGSAKEFGEALALALIEGN